MKSIITPDDMEPGTWMTPYNIKPPTIQWSRPDWEKEDDTPSELAGIPIQRHAQPSIQQQPRGGHYSIDGRPYQIQTYAFPFVLCLEPITKSLCSFDIRDVTFMRLPKDYVDTFRNCKNSSGLLGLTTTVKAQIFDLPTHDTPERIPVGTASDVVRHRDFRYYQTHDAENSHSGSVIQGVRNLERHEGKGADLGIVRPDHPTLTSFICDDCGVRLRKTSNPMVIQCSSCGDKKLLNADVIEEVKRHWEGLRMTSSCSRCGKQLKGAERVSENLRCGVCQKHLDDEEEQERGTL